MASPTDAPSAQDSSPADLHFLRRVEKAEIGDCASREQRNMTTQAAAAPPKSKSSRRSGRRRREGFGRPERPAPVTIQMRSNLLNIQMPRRSPITRRVVRRFGSVTSRNQRRGPAPQMRGGLVEPRR